MPHWYLVLYSTICYDIFLSTLECMRVSKLNGV